MEQFGRNLEWADGIPILKYWRCRIFKHGAQRAYLCPQRAKMPFFAIYWLLFHIIRLEHKIHYIQHKILVNWWNFHIYWTINVPLIDKKQIVQSTLHQQQRWRCPWNKRSGTRHFFPRWLCPWNKRSGTWRFFKDDSSLKQAQWHLSLFQRWQWPWNKSSGTQRVRLG